MTIDVVGVGASPLVLLHAIRLASEGLKVVLCDRSARLGGAWAVDKVLGFDNVELGVHLFENRPELHRLLDSIPGIELRADPCAALIRGRIVSMSAARVVLHSGVALNSLRRGAPDRARRSLQSAWRAARQLKTDFVYPRCGAGGLSDSLARRFRALGGEIRLDMEIDDVDIADGRVICSTAAHKLIASRMMVSSRACPTLRLQGRPIVAELEYDRVCSAVLHLRTSSATDLSYVEIIGDPHLKRIRDVGRTAHPTPEGRNRLFCVQYRKPAQASGRDLASHLTDQLIRLRLIGSDADIVGMRAVDHEMRTVTDRGLRSLARAAGPMLIAIPTTDFADGLVSTRRAFALP